ncbi:MAG: FAD-dependent oxidoreductase [Bacillota bacterium]|nr:FAD-dependent oxidoreductase [Bacillota bacterium]
MPKQYIAPGIYREKDNAGANIYRIEGTDRTILFDAADVSDAFTEGADILVINNCTPDRATHINRIIEQNPGIILAGTATTLNFTAEYLGIKLNKHIIRRRESMNAGGFTIELVPVPNINRSRHQDRTWKKSYRFLQMPNWQWTDTICLIVKEHKLLVSGQLFSSKEGSRERFFAERLRPFYIYVEKALKLLEREDLETILPEEGDAVKFDTGIREYREWTERISSIRQNEKYILIPYASRFGCTRHLAEAVASGAERVEGIRTHLVDLSRISLYEDRKTLAEIAMDAEEADGLAVGTPTIDDDAAVEVMQLLATMSESICRGKPAAAFGSYSYREKGTANALERMKQLGMQVTAKGFAIRFKPDENEIEEAAAFGEYFGECVKAGEILDRKDNFKPEAEQEETVHTNRRFVIIGNGAAGTAAAEEIRRLDKGCSIKLISREPYKGYNRQMLTKCILREIPEKNIFLYEDSWYEDRNIDLLTGVEVTRIDQAGRQVMLKGRKTVSYDRLILATGAEPVRADLPGSSMEGIFCVHDLSEISRIRNYISGGNVTDVVILGGGILGLETAADIAGDRFKVTIIDRQPYLMAKQLDEKAGRLVEEKLREAGVNIITTDEVRSFTGQGPVAGVELESGAHCDAQLVIQCLGIRENSRLLEGMAEGLHTDSCSGGIAVNERMETGIPNIFACGDCAVFNGNNYGLWTQAVEMARVAAANAVFGGEGNNGRIYSQVIPAVSFTGFGMSVFAVGDNGKGEASAYQTKEVRDHEAGVYKKLYFKNRKFCGGILFGNVDMTTLLLEAYEKRTAFEEISV